MKSSPGKTHTTYTPVLLLLGLLLIVGGCSDTSPTEPPVVPPLQEALSVIVSGSVLDKSTGNVIDGALVSFFEGANAATNILDVNGAAITSVSVSGGSFQVTTNDITSFTIEASADGYIGKSLDISFDENDKTVVAQLNLIPEDAKGISVVEVETAVVAATVAQQVTVTTEEEEQVGEEDTTQGSAEVVIPAAVELQDAEGNPVSGSILKVEVTYVESQEIAAGESAEETTSIAAVIPEGLNAGTAISEVLVPVGVAEINMSDENQTEIKNFSAPITITINLPADTAVPSEGSTVQENDQFTVRSYDDETKIWSTEANAATVGALDGDIYPANFEVDHLTFFALTDPVPVCEDDVNFSFSGDAIPDNLLVMSIQSEDINQSDLLAADDSAGVVLSATGDKFLPLSENTAQPGAGAKLLGLSVHAAATVLVKDLSGNTWFDSGQKVTLCGETIPVALDNPVQAVDENLAVSLVCSNDTTVTTALVNAVVTYRKDANSAAIVAVEGAAGSYALTGLDSSLSEYLVTVDSRTDSGVKSTTITPDGTDESLEISLSCSVATGTGSS